VGHYVTNFPLNKSKKGSSEGSEGEALASQFELDFTLITCMVSSMMGCGWFLDIGASFHKTNDKSLFNTLEEKDLQMRITLTDVKYVPGLKKLQIMWLNMKLSFCDCN